MGKPQTPPKNLFTFAILIKSWPSQQKKKKKTRQNTLQAYLVTVRTKLKLDQVCSLPHFYRNVSKFLCEVARDPKTFSSKKKRKSIPVGLNLKITEFFKLGFNSELLKKVMWRKFSRYVDTEYGEPTSRKKSSLVAFILIKILPLQKKGSYSRRLNVKR